MDTQAYFTNISSHISTELKKASVSIYVAVAWFTDARLFSVLCNKAKAGLNVQLILMNDDINKTYGLNYTELEACGGKVYMIDVDNTGTLMHNKFCVIDGQTTITGSYNWSNKAQTNHENITITWDSENLANMFLEEFKRIKVIYHGQDPLKTFDGEIVNKRLQIIRNLIQLNEFDQISLHITKITEYQLSSELFNIIELITITDYALAASVIDLYLIRAQAITPFQDLDIEQIKWEIKYLEIEIVSLESEKITIEKIISDFVHTYTLSFGDLLLKILKLKKEKLKKSGNNKKSESYEKAEEEYSNQKSKFTSAKEETFFELNNEEKDELKRNYRKASTLCHPDKFSDDEQKRKAHKVFMELQEAYKQNDLNRVNEILDNLENGIFDIKESSANISKDQLLKRVVILRKRRTQLTNELILVRNDKSYRDIISIKNMTTFFEEEKVRLENELKTLNDE